MNKKIHSKNLFYFKLSLENKHNLCPVHDVKRYPSGVRLNS